MNLNELAKQIEAGKFKDHLQRHFSADFAALLDRLNADELEKQLSQVITVPINLSGDMSREWLELYYTASWYNLFEQLNMPPDASIFEIGSGDTAYIPKAMNAYSSGRGGKYVTANLNNELSRGFREKTKDMELTVEIIQDHGASLSKYYSEESFAVAAFHHALNDIIQTIIADLEGIDTIHNNWWEIEPQLLQAVMKYHHAGKLKNAAYEPFISLIDSCRQLLQKGGYMIFDNCTYAGYERVGYSSEFHGDYIDLARAWIKEADLGLEEVEMALYDSKWWMVLRKS